MRPTARTSGLPYAREACKRQARRFALAALTICFALLVLAVSLGETKQTHLRLETFGSANEPVFASGNSLAIDQPTGDLLVIEAGSSKAVSRWHSDGTPANFSALGTNAIDGVGSGPPCVPPSVQCDGTPQNGFAFGPFAGEQQVAIDNSGTATDGDIYVTQRGGSLHLVDVFASSGEYLGQITGYKEGGIEKLFGASSSPCGVAVDPSGDLFIADKGESKIYEYVSQGALHNPLKNTDNVKTFTGVSAPCNLAAGAGSSAGFLFVNKNFRFEGNSVVRLDIASGALAVVDEGEDRLVSVDPVTGHVYAARAFPNEQQDQNDEGNVVIEFDATTLQPISSFFTGGIQGLAVRGSTGHVYVSNGSGESASVYGPLVTVPDVITGPATITGDTSATLTGTVNPDGVSLTECKFEYLTDAAYQANPGGERFAGASIELCAESVGEIGTEHSPVPVHADLSGLAAETLYRYRLVAGNANATIDGLDKELKTPSKPAIKAEWAAGVGVGEATLKATINPENSETEFFFEWGETDLYGEATAKETVAVGLDAEDHTVSATLHELAPGKTFHYHVVAENRVGEAEGEDKELRTYRLPEPPKLCSNEALRIGAAALLPDCRAYELVSPAAKFGGEAGVPSSLLTAGGGAKTVQPRQASPSGEAVTYGSWSAFGEGPQSAPATSQYLSRRDSKAGWQTDNINPPFEEGFLSEPFVGFSSDLSHAAAYVIEPELTEDAALNVPDLYWRDDGTGLLSAITTAEHQPLINLPPGGKYCLSYGGASADSGRVFFAAKGALQGLVIEAAAGDGFNLYEWSAGRPPAQRLRLVSVLPDGTAAVPATTTGFGAATGNTDCLTKGPMLRHAVSSDGSRAIWTYAGEYEGAKNPLLSWIGEAERSVRLDQPNTGVAGLGGEGRFWDASLDGSKVFFTDVDKLTLGSTASSSPAPDGKPDLYLYDFAAPEGARLTDLTAPDPIEAENVQGNVEGVIGASADGSYLYFVATGKLSGEEENAEEEKAQEGQNNLYVWHEGEGIRFIATLASGLGDTSDWSSGLVGQSARVTPNGLHLAFISTKSLTGYDNLVSAGAGCQGGGEALTGDPNCPQAYLYDFEDEALACASCNPTGERPIGPSSLLGWSAPYEQPRYLSDNGDRLFFETFDALDLRDTNAKRDVYEFEKLGTGSCKAESPTFNPASSGCLYLLSNGTDSDGSYFIDASSDGGNAFISTRQSLFPTDEDERFDVYDARVEGGFAYEPSIPCEADCRGQGTSAPAVSPAGTAVFVGPPDPEPQRPCPKGKRKVRRNGKAHCVARHSKHRRKHHRRAKAGRGAGR